MTKEKDGKINRILDIYERLIQGEIIYKKHSADLFGVNEKTIQRDIEDIRAYLSNHVESKGDLEVEYRRDKKGYCISKREDSILNREDVLAICKILLESRAFCKEEINHLIIAMLKGIGFEQRKYVEEIIRNELFNFKALKHNEKLLSKIWDLSDFIRHKEIIEIDYVKIDGSEVKRTIKPLSIIFSEYYFYLIAYFDESKLDNPIIFRIDRIKKYKSIGEKFEIPEAERFHDGEFRNRIQFMYSGKLMKIKFEFMGSSLEAVLDRLPTAKVIKEYDDNKYLIEAEVFGKGIIMWILSQGSNLKVVGPDEFVKEVACEAKKLSELYKDI